MKINKIRKFLVGAVALTMIMALIGCGSKNNSNQDQGAQDNKQENQQQQTLSGSINAGGSTSVEKAAKTALEEFVALNPNVTFEYDATGSSTGIKNVKDSTYKLGFSSRELKEEEKEGCESKAIALDGIALSVNPNNKVKDLTVEQILGIYTGEITNWSEVGGDDANIVVVSRENGSGTRGAFEEIVGIEDNLTEEAIIKSGNGEVASYIANEKNAIGYISFVTLKSNEDKISGLNVNGVEPTVANVQSKEYALSRPFVMIYKTENLNDAEKAFIDFLFTEEGQSLLEEAGAIKVK